MAATTLVEFPREAARTLTQKMDAERIPVTAAFWEFDSELEEWRFVVASPDVADKGTLYVVQNIHRILDEMTEEERDEMSLLQIRVLSTQQLKIRDTRAHYGVVETEQMPLNKWQIQRRDEP